MKNPLEDGVHIVNYNINNLENKLETYLEDFSLRNKMSIISKKYVYDYHTPENRIKYILNKITK